MLRSAFTNSLLRWFLAVILSLIEELLGHPKFVSEAYLNSLSLEEDQVSHNLQTILCVLEMASFKGPPPTQVERSLPGTLH